MKFRLLTLMMFLSLVLIATGAASAYLPFAEGHGGVQQHDLAFGGELAHFPFEESGVSYSFGAGFPVFATGKERTFPDAWKTLVDDAADLISDDDDDTFLQTFIPREGSNAGNILIYVGNWYDGFDDSSSRRIIRSLCGDPGRGDSVVCPVPTLPVAPSSPDNPGIGFQLDVTPLLLNSKKDHLGGTMHLIFDRKVQNPPIA